MRLPPAGRPFRYLNVPVAWATSSPPRVDKRGLAERHRRRAVQATTGADQAAETGRRKLVFISIVTTPDVSATLWRSASAPRAP